MDTNSTITGVGLVAFFGLLFNSLRRKKKAPTPPRRGPGQDSGTPPGAGENPRSEGPTVVPTKD